MAKRWKQRPEGSTWGDWGDDDELGRINLLTPEKVLAGRARGRGRHQLLPEPAARLSRRHRAEPAPLPAAPRADRGPRRQSRGLLQRPPEGDPEVRQPASRRRVGRRPGDALAAVLDAVGLARARGRRVRRRTATASRKRSTTTATAPGSTSSARRKTPQATAATTRASRNTSASSTWRSTACRAAACSSTSRTTSGTSSAASTATTLEEIMAADNVVVEPGDMVLIHTGFATEGPRVEPRTRIPWRSTGCARTSTRTTPRCSSGSPTRRSPRSSPTTTRSKAWSAGQRVEGRHSLLPIHHLCLFKLGVPLGEMWYLHELATWLREHNRSRFLLTAPPAAPARRRRLAAHADRDRLTTDESRLVLLSFSLVIERMFV